MGVFPILRQHVEGTTRNKTLVEMEIYWGAVVPWAGTECRHVMSLLEMTGVSACVCSHS